MEAAGDDRDAILIARNMLGVAYFLLNQPAEAAQHHLQCLDAVNKGYVKDLSLRLSILRNLANDYWALHDVSQAIAAYKRALPLVEDLDSAGRQADIYWALAMAYRAANDWAQAKLYATRALHIYETLDDIAGAAALCMHLAELLMQEGRYTEAGNLLARSEKALATIDDRVLLSNLHYDYADLNRRQGDLAAAAESAQRALSLIQEVFGEPTTEPLGDKTERKSRGGAGGVSKREGTSGAQSGVKYPPLNVVRTYVEALHVAALVEEERGNRKIADTLFEKAQSF